MGKVIRWTDKEDTELKNLIMSGLSFGQASKILNKSRNALIGRADRIGIKSSFVTVKSEKKLTEPKIKLVKKVKIVNIKEPDLIETPVDISFRKDGGIGLLDLTIHTCRWPVGDPASSTFVYCGEEKNIAKSYCSHHCKIAYIKSSHATKKEKKGNNANV